MAASNDCPYCGSETFEAVALPADLKALEFSNEPGDWFNRCSECGQWSRFLGDTNENIAIDQPEIQPEAFSR